jgi:CRP-like cAMP-binding protein/uncharacterized membrane protein YidH (DUF202 family)
MPTEEVQLRPGTHQFLEVTDLTVVRSSRRGSRNETNRDADLKLVGSRDFLQVGPQLTLGPSRPSFVNSGASEYFTPPMTPKTAPAGSRSASRRRRSSALLSSFEGDDDKREQRRRVIEPISKQELTKMEALFQKFDADGDGSIEVTNLLPLLAAMGHPMTQEQASDLLNQVDVNQNGSLEYIEFLQLVTIFKDVAQFRMYERDTRSEHDADASRFTLTYNNKLLWAFDLLVLIVLTYIAISVTSLHLYSDYEKVMRNARHWDVTDILCTFVLFGQMCLRFFVAQAKTRDKGISDTDHLLLASLSYARSFLLCDVIALLPLRLFSSDTSTSVTLGHLRLLALVRFPSILAAPAVHSITHDYVHFYYTAAPVIKNLAVFVIGVHCLAVVALRVIDSAQTYATGVYLVMYMLSGVGYGNVSPQATDERMFLAFLCCVAMMVNGIVVGGIVSFLSQSDVEATRRHRLVQTLAVLNFFEVPQSLQEEVLQFQDHVMKKDIQTAYGSLTDHLPYEMKAGLTLQFRIHLVQSLPLFRAAHESAQITLAKSLFSQVIRPEEYIVLADEVGDAMFFINYGYVDLFTAAGSYLTTRGPNKNFGAEAILESFRVIMKSEKIRDASPNVTPSVEYIGSLRAACGAYRLSAKTITFVEVMMLTSESFTQVMSQFPRFRLDVEEAVNSGVPLGDSVVMGLEAQPTRLETSVRRDMSIPRLLLDTCEDDDPVPDKPERPRSAGTVSASSFNGLADASPGAMEGGEEDSAATVAALEKELVEAMDAMHNLLTFGASMPSLQVTLASPEASVHRNSHVGRASDSPQAAEPETQVEASTATHEFDDEDE